MSVPDCAWASDWERQVSYFSRELPSEDETRFEDHVFACDTCGDVFRRASLLVGTVRGAGRSGALFSALSAAMLARLKRDGLRTFEAAADPGGTLRASIPPDVDLMVGHLRADLGGVRKVDVEFDMGPWGVQREVDVPVDSPSEVTITCVLHLLDPTRGDEDVTRCRILAGEGDDRRVLAEYSLTFGFERAETP